MTHKEQLRTRIKARFRSLAAFARAAGLDYNYLNNYLRSKAMDQELESKADLALTIGETVPDAEALRQKVLNAYPIGGVSAFVRTHSQFNYLFVSRVLRGEVAYWHRPVVRQLVDAINKLP